MAIIAMLLTLVGDPIGGHGLVELMAGHMAISTAFASQGLVAAPFDIKLSRSHDILSPEGFLNMLWSILNLDGDGLLWAAPMCSNFIHVCKWVHGRSHEDPLGNTRYKSVRDSNVMASRIALLIRVAVFIGVMWAFEQSNSSVFEAHPRIADVLHHSGYYLVRTWLGAFGAPTPKLIKVYSWGAWIFRLERQLVRSRLKKSGTTEITVSRSGRKGVQGIKKQLKDTQAYPPAFGVAVVRNFSNYGSACGPPPWGAEPPEALADPWDDANLKQVEDFLAALIKQTS